MGCQNFDEEPMVDVAKLESFNELSVGEQRVAFSLLSINEREVTWQSHVQDFIDNKKLSKAQLNVVLDLKKIITPEVFGSEDKTSLKEIEGKWLDEALKVFTEQEIYQLAYTLESHNNLSLRKLEAQVMTEGGEVDCTCNKESSIHSCGTGDDCSKTNCDYQTTGCGWFWNNPCNAACGNEVP